MWPTLKRGVAAGGLVGVVYGLFTAVVVHPLTASLAEIAHHGGHGHDAGAHSHAVSETTTAVVSVGSGVLWGIFLGAALGLAYYFLEPAVPGSSATRPYVLAGAGFLTVSVGPWLALPPVAPGMEHQLAASTRLVLYAGLMLAGAVLAVLGTALYRRAGDRRRGVAAGLAPIVAAVAVVPLLTPTVVTAGGLSTDLVAAYRGLVVFGQAGLWFGLATAFRWLGPAPTNLDLTPHETQI
ncbi:cobalamin cluster protein [Halovenus sp. WSH3]|uniref:Cobalamin cluster protein n=1 Tax=Halovenus carboxidivorans TaxID=2692199 RepID=A0A6B0TA16_9EURY|nr:CbtA family protein [Halovenus carboxidivorans]MXR50029.1 cobalamin cluster protein [Halovenus carboxidivorans]